jgi:hypothetical protein
MHPDDVLWWSKGGLLHGDSWQGIAFLKTIMADIPPKGLTPIADIEDNGLFYHRSTRWYWTRISGGMADDYYLIYLGEHQIAIMPFWSNDDQYEVEIIDTREMTIKPIAMKPFDKATMTQHAYDGTPLPSFYIELPSKPYLVVRIKRKAALI